VVIGGCVLTDTSSGALAVEGGPGKKKLIHVQKTFERFSVGKPGDKSMNQKTFQEFCEEMGMVNPGEGLQ
jgi:hypothetical protein